MTTDQKEIENKQQKLSMPSQEDKSSKINEFTKNQIIKELDRYIRRHLNHSLSKRLVGRLHQDDIIKIGYAEKIKLIVSGKRTAIPGELLKILNVVQQEYQTKQSDKTRSGFKKLIGQIKKHLDQFEKSEKSNSLNTKFHLV